MKPIAKTATTISLAKTSAAKAIRRLSLPLLLVAATHAWAAADTQEDRIAAAHRYLEVAQMGKIMDDAQAEMAKSLPPEQQQKFLDFMRQAVRLDVLEKAAMDSMVKIFTADEMNALADFFSSPAGKSAMGKFGLYMADVMPIIQQEIFRAVQTMATEQGKR
ncbi:MAG TPA: DUF2059 domain-containing protein [Burkholderiales bacterium]|nr:DUF2059 domain-containing protein [Burkholderiales bacterium]